MSAFWYAGMPFLGVSFIGTTGMLIFLDEINPGYSLFDYMTIVGVVWVTGILSVACLKQFKYMFLR